MRSVPEISICVPTYNGGAYLGEALHSALEQDFENIEVLVVDDGSVDATADIVKALSTCDDRIRFIENERTFGLPGNWTRAASLSRGEWVKFLFQDDTLEKSCLSQMLSAAKAAETRLVACNRTWLFEEDVDEETQNWYHGQQKPSEVFCKKNISTEDYSYATAKYFGQNIIGEPTALLLHKSIFYDYGSFNNNIKIICDTEYCSRIATNEDIYLIEKSLCNFRVHNKSTTSLFRSHNAEIINLDAFVLAIEYYANPLYSNLRRISKEDFLGKAVEIIKKLGPEFPETFHEMYQFVNGLALRNKSELCW